MKVLFVCSGNICRSPMAHAYLHDRAVRAGLSHLVVDSAGLLGIEGQAAASHSADAVREYGIDLSRHRSQGIRAEDVRTSDVIVVMTQSHLEEMHGRFPGAAAEMFLLRAFERGPEPRGGAADLEDPVVGPLEAHRASFETIRLCVDHLILRLKHGT